jgi:hypothetical protein
LEQDEQDPLNIASLPEVMPTHAAMAEPEDVAEAKQETDVVLEPPKDDPHDESAVEIPNQKDLFASPAAPKKGQTTKTKEHKPAKPVAPPAQEARPRRRRGKEVAELRLDPRTPIQSQPARHPELAPVPPTAPPATDLESKSPVVQDIVQQMLAEAEGYFTLEEAAQVIVEDAAARASAECAALLVPDGSLWRVAGGVGLRPLEHRLQLTTESWLVANIAGAGKGAIVEGSDVARNNLRGAPLASHTHLLAAPVPQVRAVLLVARERDEPFSEETLTVLATLAEESGPLLDQALKLRSLARGLARHIDPWDAPAS